MNIYNSHNSGDLACLTGNKLGNFEAYDEEQEAAEWERQEEEGHKEEEQVCLNKVSVPSGQIDPQDLSPHPPDLSTLNGIRPVPTKSSPCLRTSLRRSRYTLV